MIKSIIRKLRNTEPINRCSKCGTPDSNDDYSDYFYLERSRGRDFEDGYEIFAGGWYCKKCDHYEWLIPNDNDWLATQDPDVVLPDVWKLYNDKRIADAKEAHDKKMQVFELELKEKLDKVDAAIKVFTDDNSSATESLVSAGKILVDELDERKAYITQILHTQACIIGLNNHERRLLRCWGHDEVEYEDE